MPHLCMVCYGLVLVVQANPLTSKTSFFSFHASFPRCFFTVSAPLSINATKRNHPHPETECKASTAELTTAAKGTIWYRKNLIDPLHLAFFNKCSITCYLLNAPVVLERLYAILKS